MPAMPTELREPTVHELLPYAVAEANGRASAAAQGETDGERSLSRSSNNGHGTGSAEEGIVAKCVDDRHPTLAGRVLVRWDEDSGSVEKWVPTLQQVPIRVDDRVLLMRPMNFDEPVVVGVLDGFSRRPEPSRETAASLELKRDEAVRVAGSHGEPLLELYRDEKGPVVRLLQEDVDVEFPGALRMSAARIELEATRGSVDITANDDVNVDGEIINLNC